MSFSLPRGFPGKEWSPIVAACLCGQVEVPVRLGGLNHKAIQAGVKVVLGELLGRSFEGCPEKSTSAAGGPSVGEDPSSLKMCLPLLLAVTALHCLVCFRCLSL